MAFSSWLVLNGLVVVMAMSSASAAVLRAPVASLVETSRMGASSGAELGATSSKLKLRRQPKTPHFFTEDPIKMAQSPPNYEHKNVSCHPKCTWSCDEGGVNCPTKCKPLCKAPECATICQKPLLSQCHSECEDPKCALICPPSCPNGGCPSCYTVCGEPKCQMVCGHNFCESKCADPVCAWDCAVDKSACPEPACRMVCDTPKCLKNPFLDTATGPSAHEAMYAGQEVAWAGLAKIPKSMKDIMTPRQADGAHEWLVPAPAQEAADEPTLVVNPADFANGLPS